MELRFAIARSTRDLDFTLRAGNSESALKHMQAAGALEIGDFFSFRVGEAIRNLDAAPDGGVRYPVECRLDGRTLVRFHVDADIGDLIVQPLETAATRNWLAFAEIPSPSVTMISREQQFAEKVHAYTLPRPSLNSRVRDLVDLHLLIASGSLDVSLCAEALRRTFERRNTHGLPIDLVPPPTVWERPFRVLAEECQIETEFLEAYDNLLRFWSELRKL